MSGGEIRQRAPPELSGSRALPGGSRGGPPGLITRITGRDDQSGALTESVRVAKWMLRSGLTPCFRLALAALVLICRPGLRIHLARTGRANVT